MSKKGRIKKANMTEQIKGWFKIGPKNATSKSGGFKGWFSNKP